MDLELNLFGDAPIEQPPAPTLLECVRFLSGLDTDYVSEANGVGWNRLDAERGHALAERDEDEWSEWDRFWAWRATRKYVNTQLVPNGIRADRMTPVPMPKKPGPERNIQVAIEGRFRGYFEIVYRGLPNDEFYQVKEATWKIPGRQWDAEHKCMVIPPDRISAVALKQFAIEHNFHVSESATSLIWDVTEKADTYARMSRAVKPSASFVTPDERLWPAQQAGVEYILTATKDAIVSGGASGHGVYVVDEMGTGKTATALLSAYQASVMRGEKLRLLWICPANTKYNAEREAYHWLGVCRDPQCDKPHRETPLIDDLEVTVCEGRGFQPITGHVVIVNFDALGWAKGSENREVNDLLMLLDMAQFPYLVIDEAHYIKNDMAQRTLAVKKLTETQRPFTLAMSGTPALNRTEELVSGLDVTGLLPFFGNANNFKHNYCRPYGDRKTLNKKLREIPGWLGRLKRDHVFTPDGYLIPLDRVPEDHLPVELRDRERREQARGMLERLGYEWVEGSMPQLANIARSVELMQLNEKWTKEYDRALTEFKTWLLEHYAGKFDDDEAKSRWARGMRNEILVQIGKLRQVVALGKVDPATDWMHNVLESDEKLVVFTCFKETQERIVKRLAHWNPMTIHGGQSAKERDEIVQKFQHDPDCRLLVGQLLAAGEGINLTAACHVGIVENYWNPGKLDQAANRVDRGGQTRDVTVHYLFAAQTIDQRMSAIVDKKRVEVEAATHGGDSEATAMLTEMLDAVMEEV